MAQTNYTPIQIYYSTTAAAVPVNTNLLNGELAINITDGKLYYKDNSGTVQVIATKGAGTIGGSTTQVQFNDAGALAGSSGMTYDKTTTTLTVATLNLTNALGAVYGGTGQSTYTAGDLLYSSATNTLSKLALGTANYILTVNSAGTNVQWSAPSAISVSTATNLAGGVAGSVPYQSGASTTTFLGIGAADRVMTSSGSAPQWVTALTGLTGVSSSSITNTSLTSGRVVYSSTGGLQANSANLTFDGTTLTTTGLSNSGTSALVKLVTVGGTSFSGTTVFAPATPAKLYMGTGTVTDTTSAIGATNAVGAVASLAITPIAATNTSVTYTDASTLYIAGAPSAGTNVTLTNPYALYIAAGNVYLGGGTASGVAYLNSNKVLTTGSALTFDGTNFVLNNGYIRANNTIGYYTNLTATGLTNFATSMDFNSVASHIFSINSSEIFRTTSTSLYTASGINVGIGTSSPAFKLDVASTQGVFRLTSTSGINPVYLLTSNGGGDFYFGRENSTGSTFGSNTGYASVLYSAGAYPIVFLPNGTERMRLDTSGNLGLGVTPSAWNISYRGFEVAAKGNGLMSATNSNSMFVVQNTYYDGSWKANAALPVTQYAQSNGTHYWTTNPSPGANTAFTPNQVMTLDSSGNLGVGTTSPGAKLEVNQEATAFPGFKITGSNSPGMQIVEATGVTAHFVNDSAGVYVGSSTSYPLILRTNNTERARIDTSGIVTMNAYGAGAATFSAAGVISSVSDETWKIKDGVPVDPDSMLKKLEPGYWYYNDEKKETFGADRQLGFYAQNVNAAIGPEAAPTPEEGKPWGYYDRSVLAVTVMSLQKALATIEALTARITALEGA